MIGFVYRLLNNSKHYRICESVTDIKHHATNISIAPQTRKMQYN